MYFKKIKKKLKTVTSDCIFPNFLQKLRSFLSIGVSNNLFHYFDFVMKMNNLAKNLIWNKWINKWGIYDCTMKKRLSQGKLLRWKKSSGQGKFIIFHDLPSHKNLNWNKTINIQPPTWKPVLSSITTIYFTASSSMKLAISENLLLIFLAEKRSRRH